MEDEARIELERKVYLEALGLGRTPENLNEVIGFVEGSYLKSRSKINVLMMLSYQNPLERNFRTIDDLVSAEAYLKAAEMTWFFPFCCLFDDSAGICLGPGSQSDSCKQNRYGWAGSFFNEIGEHQKAFECYEKTNDLDFAAKSAERAGNFFKAAKLYEKFAIRRFAEAGWNNGIAGRSCYLPDIEKAIELYERIGKTRKVSRNRRRLEKFNKIILEDERSRDAHEGLVQEYRRQGRSYGEIAKKIGYR